MNRIILVVFAVLLAGCSGTLPVEYTAQSFGKLPGTRANMGEFTYKPASEGKVKSNQIQNTAVGQVLIGEDVSNYVRRATALELEKAGTNITGNAARTIEANVLEAKTNDLGFSVTWSYAVLYTVKSRSTGNILFQKTYKAEDRETGKFGLPSDYTSTFNLMILDGIEQFMADVRDRRLLR